MRLRKVPFFISIKQGCLRWSYQGIVVGPASRISAARRSGVATLIKEDGQNLNFAIPVEQVSATFLQPPSEQVATSGLATAILPKQYFNDYAGVIPPHSVADFNDVLARFERETSNQIIVAIYSKLDPNITPEQFGEEAFRA
jgi:hypothetical protein